MKTKRKKVISIDLDGVLNNYCGIYKENEIAPVKEGAFQFLKKLSENFMIEIYTVRNAELCKEWLTQNELIEFVKDVGNTKNYYSSMFLDDRAINFDGDYNKAYSQIMSFRPYWKN